MPSTHTSCSCDRRDAVRTGVAAALGVAGTFLLPRVAFADPTTRDDRDTLVCVFLRGGMDGLSAVVPADEPAYQDARPTIGLDPADVLGLDGRFGLHPALAPLLPLWEDGLLGIVHAAGNPNPTRSHFDAMDELERGTPGQRDVHTGWLARHLEAVTTQDSPFRAMSMSLMLPRSLQGYAPALAIESLAEFHLDAAPARLDAVEEALRRMYEPTGADDAIGHEAQRTFATVAALAQAVPEARVGSQTYPRGPLGAGLAQVAQLITSDVGLEVACVDAGGWDTHETMGTAAEGRMHDQLASLGGTLAAFADDLGDRLNDTTVLVVTEFGRRLAENGSRGTDHGRGTAYLALGGGVNGGRVHGAWPGLEPDALDRGDLAVTTDFRDVLAEALRSRVAGARLDEVFPGHTPRDVGLFRPR